MQICIMHHARRSAELSTQFLNRSHMYVTSRVNMCMMPLNSKYMVKVTRALHALSNHHLDARTP